LTIDSEKEVEALKRIGWIVAECLQKMKQAAVPGMTTLELDSIGAKFLELHGARSAPILTYNFPGHTCISVNSVVAHGIPSDKFVLREGDIVNVDVSAELDGYFGDTGGSFGIGEISPIKKRVCEATLRARDDAISKIRDGAPFSIVGKTVSRIARKEGFSVLEDLQSHGVGRGLHEEPAYIPSHFVPAEKRVFKKGMVITIEPFLTTGPRHVFQEDDGWSLSLRGGHIGAQYEHTLIVTDGEPILTTICTHL
jgi:methionyl aminopeptidase